MLLRKLSCRTITTSESTKATVIDNVTRSSLASNISETARGELMIYSILSMNLKAVSKMTRLPFNCTASNLPSPQKWSNLARSSSCVATQSLNISTSLKEIILSWKLLRSQNLSRSHWCRNQFNLVNHLERTFLSMMSMLTTRTATTTIQAPNTLPNKKHTQSHS